MTAGDDVGVAALLLQRVFRRAGTPKFGSLGCRGEHGCLLARNFGEKQSRTRTREPPPEPAGLRGVRAAHAQPATPCQAAAGAMAAPPALSLLATTLRRHGLSTPIASTAAAIFRIAATRNTASQLPVA